MKLTLWSAIGGKVSGHLVLDVSQDEKVSSLIQHFCSHKGIQKGRYFLRRKDLFQLDQDKTLKEEGIKPGEVLMMCCEEEKGLFFYGNWCIVSSLALFISIIGLVYASMFILMPPNVTKEFSVIIDAGSSHSFLYVFSWDPNKPLGTASDVTLEHRCFMSGGVASYKSHPEELSSYLQPCLKEVQATIPKTQLPQTPAFFAATAGMRILRDFDPVGASLILSSIREVLLRKSQLQVPHHNIFIASGKVEGLSGWIATNYLLGTLLEKDEVTSAVLDVGGASLQLSRGFLDNLAWQTTNVTLYEQTRSVYSHTFLCYGLAEAHNRYKFLLVNQTHSNRRNFLSDVVEEPCLSEGYRETYGPHDFNVPCTLNHMNHLEDNFVHRSEQGHMKHLKKYIMTKDLAKKFLNFTDKLFISNDTSKHEEFSIIGTSDPSKCEERMKLLFNESLCNQTFQYGSCLNKRMVPTFGKELVAFSDIFALLLPLFKVNSQSSLEEFRNAVYNVCRMNVTRLQNSFPDLDVHLQEDLCFDGMYIYTLLTEGLGIDSRMWNDISFTKEIRKNEVEWSLGFIVNRTTDWPSKGERLSFVFHKFILLVILFALFVFSSLILFHHAIMILKSNRSYQRLLNQHIDDALMHRS